MSDIPLEDAGQMAGSATTTRTTSDTVFDAENRTVSRTPVVVRTRTTPAAGPSSGTTTTTTEGATTVGWGPNGHPAVVAGMTLHWDGDIILFLTDASGNVIDFKAGLDGEAVAGQPLQVYDRDLAGLIINSWTNGQPNFVPLDPQDGSSVAFSPNSYLQYVRPDGFTVNGIQINGVRAFDPALQTWTTPDAFEGDIHDPASQQKYMWNRGNPVDYSDPSGYCAGVLALPCAAGGLLTGAVSAGAAAASGVILIPLILATGGTAGEEPGTIKELPKGLIGKNPKNSGGKRTNTEAPAGRTPEDVFEEAGGTQGIITAPDGQKVAPNGVRLRPATPSKGPRVEVPANGSKPHEGIHWPDPPKPATPKKPALP